MMRRIACTILLLTWAAGVSRGEVSMRFELGWEGKHRSGRWMPLFITVADEEANRARNVAVEVLSPRGEGLAQRVITGTALTPEPRRLLMYVPLSDSLDETVVVVRDLASRRVLGEWALAEPGNGALYWGSGHEEVVIGIAGRSGVASLSNVKVVNWDQDITQQPEPEDPDDQDQRNAASQRRFEWVMATGRMDAARLPDAPVGYDALDVLYLNGIDLVQLTAAQERAIAQWVRAGGRLMVWPGSGLIAPGGMIDRLLPCDVGENVTLEVPLEATKKMGVMSRVDKVAGRKLSPRAGSQSIPMAEGMGQMIVGRAGLGVVGVMSLDAGEVMFEQGSKEVDINRLKFWRPVLREIIEPEMKEVSQNWYTRPMDQRRAWAMNKVIDRLGDVPGIGQFDFTWIALVMAAMMIVVGPVDWIVLKKLGRQPWTWATTFGWIALLTAGALYIGQMFRSGELHYRTLRVIDQAGENVVGVIDVAGIYSPKSRRYELEVDRESWWEPATMEARYRRYRRGNDRLVTEIATIQDGRGTRPAPLPINVWNLRFLEGELGDTSDEKPVVMAELKIETETGGQRRVKGTIRNVGPAALRSVRVRTPWGTVEAAGKGKDGAIEAGETVNLASIVRSEVAFAPWRGAGFGYIEDQHLDAYEGGEPGFMRAAGDVAVDRSQRIEQLLAPEEPMPEEARKETRHRSPGDRVRAAPSLRKPSTPAPAPKARPAGTFACIYARMETAPAVTLKDAGPMQAKEQHWVVIRALVELKE